MERRWPLKSRRRFDPVDVLHYAIEDLVTPSGACRHSGLSSHASEGPGSAPAFNAQDYLKPSANWRIPADLRMQPYRVASAAPESSYRALACKKYPFDIAADAGFGAAEIIRVAPGFVTA
jgi:hypothetical protein